MIGTVSMIPNHPRQTGGMLIGNQNAMLYSKQVKKLKLKFEHKKGCPDTANSKER
jgi:hypothetical protein